MHKYRNNYRILAEPESTKESFKGVIKITKKEVIKHTFQYGKRGLRAYKGIGNMW